MNRFRRLVTHLVWMILVIQMEVAAGTYEDPYAIDDDHHAEQWLDGMHAEKYGNAFGGGGD